MKQGNNKEISRTVLNDCDDGALMPKIIWILNSVHHLVFHKEHNVSKLDLFPF